MRLANPHLATLYNSVGQPANLNQQHQQPPIWLEITESVLLDDDSIWATWKLIIYPFYLLVCYVGWWANHSVQINTTSKWAETAYYMSKWAKPAYTTFKWAEPALLPPNEPNQLTWPPNEPNQLYYLRMSGTRLYHLRMSWTSLMIYMWATKLNNLYMSYSGQQPKSSATSAANLGPSLALQVGMDR